MYEAPRVLPLHSTPQQEEETNRCAEEAGGIRPQSKTEKGSDGSQAPYTTARNRLMIQEATKITVR